MKTRERRRWKPAGAITILDKDRLATLYLYTNPRDGMPAAVGYRGRKTRPELHITSATQAQLEAAARRWLDGLRQMKLTADRHREARARDEWSRNSVMRRIKAALASRGFHYSVTGGRGTAWGWIHIDLLPSALKLLTPEQRDQAYRALNDALGLSRQTGEVSIPSSTDYYREYVDRAQGRTPAKLGQPYWD